MQTSWSLLYTAAMETLLQIMRAGFSLIETYEHSLLHPAASLCKSKNRREITNTVWRALLLFKRLPVVPQQLVPVRGR